MKYIALVAISIAAAVTIAVGEELTPELIKEHGISKDDLKALLAGKSLEDEDAAKAATAQAAKEAKEVADTFAAARSKAAESADVAKSLDAKTDVDAAKADDAASPVPAKAVKKK